MEPKNNQKNRKNPTSWIIITSYDQKQKKNSFLLTRQLIFIKKIMFEGEWHAMTMIDNIITSTIVINSSSHYNAKCSSTCNKQNNYYWSLIII